MRVTVLLPCFNAAPHLRECLDSVLAQSFADFQVLAIDDGSTDATNQILASAAFRDRRLRVLANATNLGLVASLNLGLRAATTPYVARIDADDIAHRERLAYQVRALEESDAAVVSSAAVLVSADGRPLGLARVRATTPDACTFMALFAPPVIHSAVLGRTDVLRAFGYSTDPGSLHVEDYELWTRLADSGYRLVNVRAPLLKVRLSSRSVSAIHRALQVDNFVSVVARHITRVNGTEVPVEVARVVANRMRAHPPDALDPAVRLLGQLTERALAGVQEPVAREEIMDCTAIQLVDIVSRALLRGSLRQRFRAAHYIPAACRLASRPAVRLHMYDSFTLAGARLGCPRRLTAASWNLVP
jgi:hypothetical protein